MVYVLHSVLLHVMCDNLDRKALKCDRCLIGNCIGGLLDGVVC